MPIRSISLLLQEGGEIMLTSPGTALNTAATASAYMASSLRRTANVRVVSVRVGVRIRIRGSGVVKILQYVQNNDVEP